MLFGDSTAYIGRDAQSDQAYRPGGTILVPLAIVLLSEI
jgi:hypothetical protein